MKHISLLSLICLILIILSYSSYAYESMSIDISLSKNDIITEVITLSNPSINMNDFYEYTTIVKPISILYDGEYSITEEKQDYKITFENLKEEITFTLLFDSIIESNDKNKVFRTSFTPNNIKDLIITATLPKHFTLSDIKPSVTPKPTSIESDGQRITLSWTLNNPQYADIIIFYIGEKNLAFLVIIPFIIVIAISSIIFLYFKKKTKKHLNNTLSSEEIKIVEELRKGVTKQKDIANNLNFSKSKMSKVVRKLEEKDLVNKKPFFKTNILILSTKIK